MRSACPVSGCAARWPRRDTGAWGHSLLCGPKSRYAGARGTPQPASGARRGHELETRTGWAPRRARRTPPSSCRLGAGLAVMGPSRRGNATVRSAPVNLEAVMVGDGFRLGGPGLHRRVEVVAVDLEPQHRLDVAWRRRATASAAARLCTRAKRRSTSSVSSRVRNSTTGDAEPVSTACSASGMTGPCETPAGLMPVYGHLRRRGGGGPPSRRSTSVRDVSRVVSQHAGVPHVVERAAHLGFGLFGDVRQDAPRHRRPAHGGPR